MKKILETIFLLNIVIIFMIISSGPVFIFGVMQNNISNNSNFTVNNGTNLNNSNFTFNNGTKQNACSTFTKCSIVCSAIENGTIGNGTIGNGTIGNGTIGNGTIGNGTIGNGSNGTLGNQTIGGNGYSCSYFNSTCNNCCQVISNCSNQANSSGLPPGLPSDNPGGPPPPQTGPKNQFANLDSRIINILKALSPVSNNDQISALAASRDLWLPVLSAFNYALNCRAGQMFYQYIEDQIVSNATLNSWITLTLFQKVLVCKSDCNFKRLLSVNNTIFTNKTQTEFAQYVCNYLPPETTNQCREAFPSLATASANISASDLQNNLAKISFMRPDQLGKFGFNDSLAIAKALTSKNGAQLGLIMAKSLGANISPTQDISSIASIASAVPLDCLRNTDPSKLSDLIGTMDVANMDPFRKGFIAARVASSRNLTAITNLLQGTSDSSIINSIPTSLFRNLSIDISNISANKLPTAYLKYYARTQLQNTDLSTITSLSTLSKIIPGITKTDMASIPTNLKVSTIVSIVNASLTNAVALNSNQRSAILNSLVDSLKNSTGSTNSSVYLASLTTTQLAVLYPLFIEAPDAVLSGFVNLKQFITVITNVATISVSDCCSYSRTGRQLFASYAAPVKFSYTNLASDDLATLGPCIVSVLPTTYLQNISYSVFESYFPTLGSAFQPDDNQTKIVQSLVNQIAAKASSQDTLVFSTLSDLALYYNFSASYAKNLTYWSTSGSSLMSTIKASRDPSSSSIQLCRIGLSNSASVNNLINQYGSSFVTNYLGSSKKRAATALTCTQLNALSSSLNQLSVDYLALLDVNVFYSCQTLLGASSNSWSSDQLNQLAIVALKYYITATNISDANIASLNVILAGFSSANLAILNFTTTTSISALGSVSVWTASQLSALNTPLTNYITNYLSGSITVSFVTSAGNLACALSSQQIETIPSASFASLVSSLSKISLTCPNIASWYTLAKTTTEYGSTLYSSASSLSELGAVITGISSTDIKLVSADSISSITNTAWKYMPASTINLLSVDQLSGLATAQVSALQNSPNYASFSSTITSGLTSLVSTGSVSSIVVQSSSIAVYPKIASLAFGLLTILILV